MSPNPNDVVLDADGVMFDCDGGFAAVASCVLQRPVSKVSRSYDMKQRYGLSAPDTERVWKAMVHHDAGWAGFDVLPGARNAFFRLKAMGCRIHMVTAIEEDIRHLREACLAMHGLLPDSIHCAGGMHASKAQIVQAINPIAMVDDRLNHLHAVPFVPNRVFVDNDDEQGPFVVDEDIIQVKSLQQWVSSWELCQGKPFRRTFRSIG